MNKLKELKVYFQNHCKKFVLPADFESLVNLVSNSFNLTKESLIFNYFDEEGDKIIITNKFDYEQIIQFYKENENFNLKLHLEKSHSKFTETITTPIEQSLLMLNSQIDDEFNKEEVFDLKNRIQHLIKIELEDKIDNFKNKLVNALDSKLNNLVSQFFNTSHPTNIHTNLKRPKSCSNLKIRNKKEDKHILEESSHNLMKLNSYSSSSQSISDSKNHFIKESEIKISTFLNENITCRICGHIIDTVDNYYNCVKCENVYFCNTCQLTKSNFSKHILMHIKKPDEDHLSHLKYLRKSQKSQVNKNKFLTYKEKYFPQNNLIENLSQIAFNNFSDKIVIEIKYSEENFINDFYNFKFNFVNLSHELIKSNSYFECLFDQSDIFGNKIIIEEIIKAYEEFELKIMFYNFKNKPSGYYNSKWRLVLNDEKSLNNNNSNISLITFVFHIKSKDVSNDDIYNIDLLKDKRSFSFGNKNEMIYKPARNKEKTKSINKSIKFPDLFNEIIKKHQQNK